MAKLSSRERNLGVMILLVVVFLFQQRVSKSRQQEILGLEGEIRAARERMNQSRALMATLPKTTDQSDRRPAAMNDTTMRMLKDVTVPVEIQGVKIVAIDHPKPTEYKMIVEGRFGGIMKFLSYLERPEGDFRVQHVDIGKVTTETKVQDENNQNARDLRGTFELVRRS